MIGSLPRNFLLSALILVAALVAQATSFIEKPFPETVEEAPLIVRGRAGIGYTQWVMGLDGVRRIHTITELAVEEVLKGKPKEGRTFYIRELGGEKDGVGMEVAGTARFRQGEEVVVFLGNENRDGSHDVFGMMMGKYNLERDEIGQDILVGGALGMATHPVLRGHEHEIPGGHEQGDGQDDTRGAKKWTIEALRDLIRRQESKTASAQSPDNSQVMRRVSPPHPRTSATPVPSPTLSEAAAPQLQPSPSDEAPQTPHWMWKILGGGAFLLVLIWLKRR